MTGYTVEQLIRELQKYPPYAWVMLHEKGSKYDMTCTTIEYDDGIEPDVISAMKRRIDVKNGSGPDPIEVELIEINENYEHLYEHNKVLIDKLIFDEYKDIHLL